MIQGLLRQPFSDGKMKMSCWAACCKIEADHREKGVFFPIRFAFSGRLYYNGH